MATCPICFEDIQEKACPDSCDHIFCLPCLEKWSKLGSFCPVDRKRYRKIVNLESDSLIQVKSRKRKKSRAVYDFSAKCEVCEDERKPEVLLLCDCCDLAFHIYCLSPPLEAIPAGQWFCPTCTSVEKKLRERNGITKEVEVDLGTSNLLFQKNRRQRKKEKFPEVKEDPEPTLDELKTDKFIKDKMCNSSVEVCNDVVFEFESVSSRRDDNGEFLNDSASSVDIDEKFEKMCKSFRFEPQSHKNKNVKASKTYDNKKHRENLNAKFELEYINPNNKSGDDLCLKHSDEVSLIDDCLSQAAAFGYLKFDSFDLFEMSHGEEKYLSTKNKSADDLCPKHSNEVSFKIDDCISQAAAAGFLKSDSLEMSQGEEKYLNQVSPTMHGVLPSCSGVSDQSIKGTFKNLISQLSVDPCFKETDLETVTPTYQNDLTKEKIFSVFDRCEGADSRQNKYFDISAKSCVFVSSSPNYCFSCKDVIIAASQNYCKMCKLKYSISCAVTEKDETYSNCLRYSQAFESSCDISKRIKIKKMNSHRNAGKNMKKVLERRQRSLIRNLRKIRDSQKISETC